MSKSMFDESLDDLRHHAPDDPDPSISPDGYPTMTNSFDENDMMETLEDEEDEDHQAELPPQEAYDLMKYTAPVAKDEKKILSETPFLDSRMRWVDDPEHDYEMREYAKGRYAGLDKVIEDQMYGDNMTDEERMERSGFESGDGSFDESGFGLSSFKRLAKKGIRAVGKGGRAVGRTAARTAKAAVSVVKHFDPRRDKQKAALIKKTNAKLVTEHANWLQTNDAKRGIRKPRSAYVAISKTWAVNELQKAGLPTSYVAGNEIASNILGDDAMGSWYNPFSWFSSRTNYVLVNTKGERVAEFNQAQYDAYAGTKAAQATQEQDQQQAAPDGSTDSNATPDGSAAPSDATSPDAMPAQEDPDMSATDESGKLYRSIKDPLADINGDDAYDFVVGSDAESVIRDSKGDMLVLGDDPWAFILGAESVIRDSDNDRLVLGKDDFILGADDFVLGKILRRDDFVLGNDSTLGEFATQILGEYPAQILGEEEVKAEVKKDELRKHNIAVLSKAKKAIESGNATSSDARAAATLANQMGMKDWTKWFIAQGGSLPMGPASIKDLSEAAVMGDWLYKLNPGYWVKSGTQKKYIDREHDELQRAREFKENNPYGQRAVAAAEAAKQAADEATDIEARLKASEGALSGDANDLAQPTFDGKNEGGNPDLARPSREITTARRVATATKNSANALVAKAESGQPFNKADIATLKKCIACCAQLRQVRGDEPAMMGAFVGGKHHHLRKRMLAKLMSKKAAGTLTTNEKALLTKIQSRMSGLYHDTLGAEKKLSKDTWIKLVALASAEPKKFDSKTKANGIVLSPAQQQHLAAMVAITRKGMAAQLKKASAMSGNADVGLSWGSFSNAIKKTASIAALPIAAAAYLTYKGTTGTLNALKWGGRKIFGRGGGGGAAAAAPVAASSAAIAASTLAARKRRIAALKRQQAAQAQTQEAKARYQAEYEAAQAEADAAQAEAAAADEQQAAEEAPYEAQPDAQTDDAGAFVGAFVGEDREIAKMVGELNDFIVGAFVGDAKGEAAAKKAGIKLNPGDTATIDAKTKAIIVAAAKNDQTGKKIRAGARVYSKYKKGDPKAKLAIAKVQAKAKKGDPQAQRDYNAVKAGKVVVNTHSKLSKKIASKNKADHRVAFTKKVENKAGDKLAQMSRKHKLVKIAHVEKKAAHGDRRAKAAIAATVVKAQKGDKKAKTNVAALHLVKKVRLASQKPHEAKNLKQASVLVKHARNGNPKAIRQVRIIQAAAKQGQPNAKRAVERMKVAAAVHRTIETGKITMPPTKHVTSKADTQKKYAILSKKVKNKTATREEGLAAAKAAQQLGLKNEAASLAFDSRKMRSSTTDIKNAAAVAAAAQGGNKEAQAVVDKTLKGAAKGDPAAINSAGNLAAVRALDTVKNGEPMPPEIAEATGLVQRARAGDPEAKRITERVGKAAQGGDSRAVEAAVALTAASAIIAATAAKPTAQKQWIDKAKEVRGQKFDTEQQKEASQEFTGLYAKVQSGDASQSEAKRARDLAMALDKPKLAAEISALMPPVDEFPLSSLPDQPLAPIRGFGGLIRESIKALLLATADPVANYREAVQSRGSTSMLEPSPGLMKKNA